MTLPTPKELAEQAGEMAETWTCPACGYSSTLIRWAKSWNPQEGNLRWPRVEFACGAAVATTVDHPDVWAVVVGCRVMVIRGLEVKADA